MIIRTAYETITPESAEDGDFADNGWIDEDGTPIDEADIADEMEYSECDRDEAIAKLAIGIIGSCVEPSSSQFHPGVWYTDCDAIHDRAYFERCEETRHSYHLDGFTEGAERAIYAALTHRRNY